MTTTLDTIRTRTARAAQPTVPAADATGAPRVESSRPTPAVDELLSGGAAASESLGTPRDLRPVDQRPQEGGPGVMRGLDAILRRADVSSSVDPTLGFDTANGTVRVRAGDTLERIAQRNGVSLDDLQAANPHLRRGSHNFGMIYVGDEVHIPGASTNTAEVVAHATDAANAVGARESRFARLERYAPGSAEARALFSEAAHVAGVPTSWAQSDALHALLRKESDGWVGRPNYTYRGRSAVNHRERWDGVHDELRRGRISATSSATGLGQMTLDNVRRLYPSGVAGIGDPLEEAVGMLRYISERYRTPDRALSFHRRNNWY